MAQTRDTSPPKNALGSEHAEWLAQDMNTTLLAWNKQEDAQGAFAREVERVRLKIDRRPDSTSPERYKFEWTAAIYVYFKHLAEASSALHWPIGEWTVCPPERPYKDEFLVDFAIWEPGYGLRIACESQTHEGAKK